MVRRPITRSGNDKRRRSPTIRTTLGYRTAPNPIHCPRSRVVCESTLSGNRLTREWSQGTRRFRGKRGARHERRLMAPLITALQKDAVATSDASLPRFQGGRWDAAVRRWSRDNGGTQNKEWTSVTTSFALRGQVSQQMENGA